MNKTFYIILGVLILAGIAGAVLYSGGRNTETPSPTEEEQAVRNLVQEFGKKLAFVSLTAEKEMAAAAIRQYYAPYVSAEILAAWEQNPLQAPGRRTSSPSPDRIEINLLERDADGSYTVEGKIIEVATGASGMMQTVSEEPVAMKLRKQNDKWVITGFFLAVPR